MNRSFFWLVVALLASAMATVAGAAETDFMEAAAPNGWVFQIFQIYQHAEDFARDDTPLDDLNVDVYFSGFRPAYWWDTGVVHAIVPVVYVSQEGRVDTPAGQGLLFDSQLCGLGDIYVGGARRWTSPNKDWWFLLGSDLRLPSGEYNSSDDPGCTHFQPFAGGGNLGSGSLSIQPFAILTKLYSEGFLGTDTGVTFNLNTSAGPIVYDPDDRLEVWQTAHIGLAKNLRVGATFKGEFDVEDDDNDNDHGVYMGVGPELMYVFEGGVVLWTKVLFDVYTNDSAEKILTAYMRLSIPF